MKWLIVFLKMLRMRNFVSRVRSISKYNRRKNTIAISSIDNVPCHAKVLRVWLKVERLRSEKDLHLRCSQNKIILFEASHRSCD